MVFVLASLPALMGFAALSIDVGHMLNVRSQLQAAADAAALAAATALPDEAPARSRAAEYAAKNDYGHSGILDPGEVEIGNWNSQARIFTQGAEPRNAVRVRVERNDARGNPVELSLAPVLGLHTASVGATATAYSAGSGPGTRFLIDSELIDTDVPAIEELAAKLGKTPEEIITDNDGDWFIDLPPGEVLTVPTGQVGDEGLFDVTHPAFPFSDSTDPSYEDFLNSNEDGSWRQGLVPKHMLDPLLGPKPVSDAANYPSYVDPEFCNVSPVFKGDINELNPVGDDPAVSIDAVNALGERRGLLAFNVIAIGDDPDGPGGSKLPDLVIRICEPRPIGATGPPSSSGPQLVLVE